MPHERAKDYRRAGSAVEQEMVPGRDGYVVVPAGTDLTVYAKSLWINAAGTVSGILVESAADTVLSFTVAASTPLPFGFRRITAAPANTIAVTR